MGALMCYYVSKFACDGDIHNTWSSLVQRQWIWLVPHPNVFFQATVRIVVIYFSQYVIVWKIMKPKTEHSTANYIKKWSHKNHINCFVPFIVSTVESKIIHTPGKFVFSTCFLWLEVVLTSCSRLLWINFSSLHWRELKIRVMASRTIGNMPKATH